MDVIIFLIFAIVAVVCAINVVVQAHPISSAISLIGVMGSLAVLYLLLGAEFIAMAQVIVYAGAVMVLFVFVIMLLNAGAEARKGRSFMVQLLGVLGVHYLEQSIHPLERRVQNVAHRPQRVIGRNETLHAPHREQRVLHEISTAHPFNLI